ncbi:MAG: hypothetical protein V9E87_17545 [Gemmatimonadales bacterium]
MFIAGPVNLENVPDPRRAARVMHTALLGGLLTISAVFLFLGVGLHVAPLIRAGDGVVIIGTILAAVGLLPIVLGVLVFRPKVPARTSGQGDAAYWQGALGPALVVWVLCEGGGVMAAVGALLTGLWAPIVTVAVAVTCLVLMGPGRFENS